MECTEGIMIGKAQALDIPIDTIKILFNLVHKKFRDGLKVLE